MTLFLDALRHSCHTLSFFGFEFPGHRKMNISVFHYVFDQMALESFDQMKLSLIYYCE